MNGELIWVLTLLTVAVVLLPAARCAWMLSHWCYCRVRTERHADVEEAFSGFSDPRRDSDCRAVFFGDGLVRTGVATKMGSGWLRWRAAAKPKCWFT
ncbi:hypothetical protein ACNKHO_14595 [Shigella flexneri]